MKLRKILCLTTVVLITFTSGLSTSALKVTTEEQKTSTSYSTKYNILYNQNENNKATIEDIDSSEYYDNILDEITKETGNKLLTNDKSLTLSDNCLIINTESKNVTKTNSVISKKYDRTAVKNCIKKWYVYVVHVGNYVSWRNMQ